MAARIIRRARGGARGGRAVRGDELFGQSANTGNRIANGARGREPRRVANANRRRLQIDGRGAGARIGGRIRAQPFDRQPTLRRDGDRSSDLRRSGDTVGDGGDGGVLHSGSQGGASGSDGRASARMIARIARSQNEGGIYAEDFYHSRINVFSITCRRDGWQLSCLGSISRRPK